MSAAEGTIDTQHVSPRFNSCVSLCRELLVDLSRNNRLLDRNIPPLQEQLMDHLGRLRVWGHQIGADEAVDSDGLLDSRLTGDPDLRNIVCYMLYSLSDALETSLKISVSPAVGMDDESDSSSNSSTSSNVTYHDSGEHRMNRRYRAAVHRIEDHINSLYSVSALLRRPQIDDALLTDSEATSEVENTLILDDTRTSADVSDTQFAEMPSMPYPDLSDDDVLWKHLLLGEKLLADKQYESASSCFLALHKMKDAVKVAKVTRLQLAYCHMELLELSNAKSLLLELLSILTKEEQSSNLMLYASHYLAMIFKRENNLEEAEKFCRNICGEQARSSVSSEHAVPSLALPPLPPSAFLTRFARPRYRVLHGFDSQNSGELNLLKDETVTVTQYGTDGWWFVRRKLGGASGWAPAVCLTGYTTESHTTDASGAASYASVLREESSKLLARILEVHKHSWEKLPIQWSKDPTPRPQTDKPGETSTTAEARRNQYGLNLVDLFNPEEFNAGKLSQHASLHSKPPPEGRSRKPSMRVRIEPPADKDIFTSANSGDRFPTDDEQTTMSAFEDHARGCPSCHDPFEVFQRGGALCKVGQMLARSLSDRLYSTGNGFRAWSGSQANVSIDTPGDYTQVSGVLRAMEMVLRRDGPKLDVRGGGEEWRRAT